MAARREWLDGSAVAWTKENRPRYDRRNQRYPSDLTPDEWRELEPLLPVAQGTGRPRTYSLQEV
ncbi:transposase, partial [Methylobacterium aquaticum]|uniref:transposase n=2 Tax=Methylobacterium aquaticum TaxID=270351 RepID=UPI003CC99E3C